MKSAEREKVAFGSTEELMLHVLVRLARHESGWSGGRSAVGASDAAAINNSIARFESDTCQGPIEWRQLACVSVKI